MTMRRADRVSVDTAGMDLRSPSSLDGVVEANDNRASRHQTVDEHLNQTASDPAAGPTVPIQDAVVVGKVPGLLQTHHAQSGSDGAMTGGENGPNDQDQNVLPCRCRKALAEAASI